MIGGRTQLATPVRDQASVTSSTEIASVTPERNGLLRIWIQSTDAAELNVTETDPDGSASRVLHPGSFPANRLFAIEMNCRAKHVYSFKPSATLTTLEAFDVDHLDL